MSKGWGARTVGGGFGPVPSAKAAVDTTRTVPEPRPMSPKEAQTLMAAELLQAMQGVVSSTTELSSRIGRAGATNGVLDVALVTLGADGLYAVDYPVTVGSLHMVNHSTTQTVTVHTGPPSSSAPAVGRGVQLCAPGDRLTMPVGQREFSVWGKPGDQFSLQVFTGLQALGVGSL